MTDATQDRVLFQLRISRKARAWIKWYADMQGMTTAAMLEKLISEESKRCAIDGGPSVD